MFECQVSFISHPPIFTLTPSTLELSDDRAKDEWRKIDFISLRKTQFSKLEQQLSLVDQSQLDRKQRTEEELEQVEYLETENLSLQKELVFTIESKRAILGDTEKENFDF